MVGDFSALHIQNFLLEWPCTHAQQVTNESQNCENPQSIHTVDLKVELTVDSAYAYAFAVVASFQKSFEVASLVAWDGAFVEGTNTFPSYWTLVCVVPLISCFQFGIHSFAQ